MQLRSRSQTDLVRRLRRDRALARAGVGWRSSRGGSSGRSAGRDAGRACAAATARFCLHRDLAARPRRRGLGARARRPARDDAGNHATARGPRGVGAAMTAVSTPGLQLEELRFTNGFTALGGDFFEKRTPAGLPNPRLVAVSSRAARLLELGDDQLDREELLRIASGNALLRDMRPIAAVYGGTSSASGPGSSATDARSRWAVTRRGEPCEIQLKGPAKRHIHGLPTGAPCYAPPCASFSRAKRWRLSIRRRASRWSPATSQSCARRLKPQRCWSGWRHVRTIRLVQIFAARGTTTPCDARRLHDRAILSGGTARSLRAL